MRAADDDAPHGGDQPPMPAAPQAADEGAAGAVPVAADDVEGAEGIATLRSVSAGGDTLPLHEVRMPDRAHGNRMTRWLMQAEVSCLPCL